ncbi:MAG: UDP-2,3-diacylglucosamine diphosphatase [Gammaproteobacteria bacterium]|nr:MAG: UDP-2,3-diacylglucosamine diphosphatase [Gammaproteobacteria bacterium]
MSTLFISDLHLDGSKPETINLFHEFIRCEAFTSEHLYILGDLFEAWIGDDDDNPEYRRIIQTLRKLTDGGIPVSVMRGNRDFLMADKFARDTGCTLLDDPTLIDLYGTPTLLMHGDSLCTDDTEHMAYRQVVLNPQWQQQILSKPIEERRDMALEIRAISNVSKQSKTDEIMDVNLDMVNNTMLENNVTQLIHGHTHRPNIHETDLNGKACRRMVLGDWHGSHGSVLRCDSKGCQLDSYAGVIA